MPRSERKVGLAPRTRGLSSPRAAPSPRTWHAHAKLAVLARVFRRACGSSCAPIVVRAAAEDRRWAASAQEHSHQARRGGALVLVRRPLHVCVAPVWHPYMRCRYVRVGAGPARTAPPPRRRYRPGTRALKEIRRYQKYVFGSAPCSCSHTHTNTHAICLPLNGVSGGQVDGAVDPAAAVRSFGVLACPISLPYSAVPLAQIACGVCAARPTLSTRAGRSGGRWPPVLSTILSCSLVFTVHDERSLC
eukprot:COSAG01_NODE_10051_length_2262_cov_2.056403_3_plen_247_part_00